MTLDKMDFFILYLVINPLFHRQSTIKQRRLSVQSLPTSSSFPSTSIDLLYLRRGE